MFANHLRARVAFTLVLAAAVLAGCTDQQMSGPPQSSDAATEPPAPPPSPSPDLSTQDQTPFQASVLSSIAEREAQGLPVPQVTTSYHAASAGQAAAVLSGAPASSGLVTVTAVTQLQFDNPQQAGLEAWPDVVVEDEVPEGADGFVQQGDYTQAIRDAQEQADPDIWTKYEYGQEPRTYTYTEVITQTAPGGTEVSVAAPPAAAPLLAPAFSSDELVLGFTYNANWFSYNLYVDFLGVHFHFGVSLDAGIASRFPMFVDLDSPEPMLEGTDYTAMSSAAGRNWSAAQYNAAGIPGGRPEETYYFLTITAEAELEVPIIGEVFDIDHSWGPDKSSDYTTPLGGAPIALPSIDIALLGASAAGVATLTSGVRVTPHIGSDEFTAEWDVTSGGGGQATGSGNLTYTAANQYEDLMPVHALDGPGTADFTIDEFEYHFTQFVLDFALFVTVELVGFDDIDEQLPIADWNLGSILGFLYVTPHSGTPDELTLAVPILNVAPTAEIDETGTIPINGVNTFLAEIGDVLTFNGHSTDPGVDDLTLSWDWGDGAPSPDVSTVYPVPYDVVDSKDHAFDEACVYTVGFKSVDDDGDFGQDAVAVAIVSELGGPAGSEGYWQHQLKGNGKTDFDEATLLCYLAVVGHVSAVFDEERDASTVAAAYDVVFLQGNHGSALEQLDRELLVAWLNFANGAVGYMELVDTDGDDIADTPFADAMATAEAVRLNPGATTAEIKAQTEIVHTITDWLKE